MNTKRFNVTFAVFLKSIIWGLFICGATGKAAAATVDWKGTTNTDWGTATNWSSGSLPAVGDAVRIGVVSFTNQPILNSGAITSIASLTLGLSGAITLTINSGSTLAVTGAITQNQNTTSYGTFTTTFSGAGTITCASLTVGSSSSFPPILSNNLLQLVSKITSFHVTGNVTVNSTNFGIIFVGVGYNNVTFSLQGGATTIDGVILTANTSSGFFPSTFASPKFSVDIPAASALTPVLNLTNASAINTSSVAGSIDFYNNTGGTGTSTVNYSGAAQEVYANGTAALDNNPKTYQYLQLTSAGAKTVDAGTLTVSNDLTSSATAVLLNTNNPTVTIGGNWTNSSSVTQGSGNITVTGSLTNNSGGTLGLGTGNLYIGTNYTNNVGGVYSQSSGITYFNGSGAQALVDNSTTGTTFQLVNFSGGGTSTMSAGTNNANFAVAGTGILTMSNGSKLVAGSSSVAYLTMRSGANATASVAAIPSGSAITGNVTVERYLTGGAGYRSYRLLSSPVFNAAVSSVNVYSLNYVQNSMYLTGNAGGGFDKTGNPTLYLFREDITPSNTTFTSGNYLGISAINNSPAYNYYLNGGSTAYNLPAGNGFLCFFRGSRAAASVAAETTTSYVPVTVTLSTTGTLNQGAIAVRNWYTPSSASIAYSTSNAGNAPVRGFNMVGNPYASAIDWSSFSSSSSSAGIYGLNVNPTVYLFDPLTKNFATYSAATGIATGNGGKIISSGQGFFVQANAASPSLTFNETAKSAAQLSAPSLLMGRPDVQAAYNSYLRLNLITDSVNRSDMVIGFNAAAKLSFNGIQDSEFLPGISSHQALAAIAADSVLAAVKFVPFPKSSLVQSVRLNVTARVSGQYTLLRSDFKEIPALYRVWLMDRFLKDSLDIRANTAYVFNIDLADTASFGPDRFLVVIRQDPALAVHLLNFTAAKATGGAQLVWNTENEQNYTDFTVERSSDGGKSFQVLGGFGSAALGTYSFLDKNPPLTTDLYRLVIQNLDGSVSYSRAIPLMYSSQSNNIIVSGISVYPNPAVAVVNLAINPGPEAPAGSSAPAYAITVVNSSGTVIKSAIATQNSWQFPVANLIPGTYFINVVNNLTKSLVGNGKFTKLY